MFLPTSLPFVEVLTYLSTVKAKSRTPSIEPFPRPGWEDSVEPAAAEINPS